MKTKTKRYLLILFTLIVILAFLIVFIAMYKNTSRLTVNEKKWIDENHLSDKVININVLNNAYVFGNNGSGVFYDFIKDFEGKYSLNINEITYNYGSLVNGVTLGLKTDYDENDIVFYKDHYVVISKNNSHINNISDFGGKKIGILSSDLSFVSNYTVEANINYISYENSSDLFEKSDETEFIIVPLHLYLEKIIKDNYHIVYHLSDVNMYFTLTTIDDTFSSVLRKYYNVWKEDFQKYYNDDLFEIVTNSMNITSTEIDAMRSITYKYGYLNNSPYEILANGNYGGIAAMYLNGFKDFADIDFEYTKYRNFNKFIKAVTKNEVDIYFGYYNLTNDFHKTENGVNATYVVVASMQNDIAINSINSLIGKTVYIDKSSVLTTYLSKFNGINIKTYTSVKDLLKLNKKNVIIMLDKNIFDYYKTHGLDNYMVRHIENINYVYGFNVKEDTAMYKLLNKYTSITDPVTLLNRGIYNHVKTIKSGVVISFLLKNIMYLLVILIVIFLFVIKKTKKIKIAKKIKNADKMRFIDQLTLLKNRNYLNENIGNWNNNSIYPQAVVIIDLNNIKGINDIDGYEKGDKQIKSAANILIKNQLDNSDIIRTDGNEFFIYLVGYSQKQITNYIHKLNKEFKKLPYNYGATFGYSMILDDIKTIEDALNEATKDLKEKKEANEKKDN